MSGLSIVDPATIRNHLNNTSPAKLSYMFPKAKRFLASNTECPEAFYSNVSMLSHRQTYIGYGNKSDFTRTLTVSPASTKYEAPSEFSPTRRRGKSFAISRDQSPDRSYLIPQMQKMPGPGQYDNPRSFNNEIRYTMRPRTNNMIENNITFKKNPGPGAYQEVNLEPNNGRFRISKFQDTKFAKINPNTARFQAIKESPGPLSYREGDGLSPGAHYVLSQRNGTGTRAFDQEARFTDGFWKSSKNPGPGQYEKPSDFGIYGDAKYYKTLENFKQ